MINKYEERLGTERMLPLRFTFKYFRPWQRNLLICFVVTVDRIILVISWIGTDALAGCRVTTSLVIPISSFSEVGGGGAPLAAIVTRQGIVHVPENWVMVLSC